VSWHADHARLPGYDSAHILQDDCPLCVSYAVHEDRGISLLSETEFLRAWTVAHLFGAGTVTNVSVAETPLLRVLYAVQQRLARYGIAPGDVPYSGYESA
jgi:hypothetical protein